MRKLASALLVGVLAMAIGADAAMSDDAPAKTLRAGIIGLDTSHAPAFAELLDGSKTEGDLAGVKIVAAFPGGSPDLPDSADRVAGYTKKLAELGVEIVPSIDALLDKS